MNDEQSGIWQMIMSMFGRKQQPQPEPTKQTQFAPTAKTVAAPTRQQYLEYATSTDNPLPMAEWIKQQQQRPPMPR